MLKKLVSGKFSLPMTFWGFGICGGVLLNGVKSFGLNYNFLRLFALTYILKVVLFSMVLSGIICILRRETTFLGLIALVYTLLQVVLGVVMVIGVALQFL